MNALIKKFWNNAGYEVIRYDPDFNTINVEDSSWRYLWFLNQNGWSTCLAGVSETFYGPPKPHTIKCHFYMFNNQKYLETDMLKIIKLKVFL